MRRMVALVGILGFALLLSQPGLTAAQEIRTVMNPLNEELAYTVDSVLRPRVMIDNLRWHAFKVEPKEGKERVPGEEIPVAVILELENLGDASADVLAVFLLEDERGTQLARLECKRMRVRAGRLEEEKTKLKVDGGVLNDTRKIWAYVEVIR